MIKFKVNQFNLTYESNNIPEKVNIKHALDWTAEAWNKVTCDTILNCWKKTEILASSLLSTLESESDEPQTPFSDSTISGEYVNIDENEISDLINQLPYQNEDIINIDEYIEIDNFLKTIDLINNNIRISTY